MKVHERIDGRLRAFIEAQPMFFVATAPNGPGGHVNVSPKGPIESLRILGPTRVAYLDVIGSGAETIAHLRENGRICVMLCAFDGPPRIVRLHGRGTVLLPADDGYAALYDGFDVPDSFAVGTSGSRLKRVGLSTAIARSVPACRLPSAGGSTPNATGT